MKSRKKRKTNFSSFLKRYWGPMPWLLEFAMVLTFILRHYTEGILIFVLLTVNAVIGIVQSQQLAERSGTSEKQTANSDESSCAAGIGC